MAAAPTTETILIADPDRAFASRTRALLQAVGYRALLAATGEEALILARTEPPLTAVVDVELPVLNGYEVCRSLRDEHGPCVGIVLISGSRTESFDVSAGLLAGADDYLAKPFDGSELLARVRALTRRLGPTGPPPQDEAQLTRRELEILTLLARGLDQPGIAGRLGISPRTVAAHIEHTLAKLGVRSRAQAVAAAYGRRLIAG